MPANLDARNFSPSGAHAGTVADPWPGVAIKSAIEALPSDGGTVLVAGGIWLVSSTLQITRDNFVLFGNSLADAEIRYVSGVLAQLWFGYPQIGIANCEFHHLRFNGIGLSASSAVDPYDPVRISNARNTTFHHCEILGHPNDSLPLAFFEGGNDVTIYSNNFVGGPNGGASAIQVQTLGGASLDTRFTLSDNIFDENEIIIIGLDEVLFTRNTFTNSRGGSLTLLFTGRFNGTSHNVTIDNNTLIANNNGCTICGIGQDEPAHQNFVGVNITNNHVEGAQAGIRVQNNGEAAYTDPGQAGNIRQNVVVDGNTIISTGSWSLIDLRGGTGIVDTVRCSNNSLSASGTSHHNEIRCDSNTLNSNVFNNTAIGQPIDSTCPVGGPVGTIFRYSVFAMSLVGLIIVSYVSGLW